MLVLSGTWSGNAEVGMNTSNKCEVAGCPNPAEVRSQSNKSEITETFLYCSDCFMKKEKEYPDLHKIGDVDG